MKKFVELVKGDDGRITIVGTNETVDRDGDIVRAKGVDISAYKNNPVMLFAHNWGDYPVAKATNIRKEADKIVFEPEFAETEEGQKVKYLVENGFIKMTSIGFIPKKVVYADDFAQLKELDPEWTQARAKELKQARRVIFESELLELSFVPIPANPTAEIVMQGKGLTTCAFKAPSVTVEESDDELLIEISPGEVKKAVPYKETPVDENAKWDGAAARRQLKEWATDANGNINMAKYRQGFAWYDAENADNITAYKLPHHIVSDGKLVAVWRGVVGAMASLLGARGGADIPEEDKRGVYNHLARHYKAVDREPPELRDWTPEEVVSQWDEEHKAAYFADWSTDDWLKWVADLDAKRSEAESKAAKLEEELAIATKTADGTTPPEEGAETCGNEGENGGETGSGNENGAKSAEDDLENGTESESAEVTFEVEGLTPDELKALMANVVVKALKK